MNILRRVEMLEATVGRSDDDMGYKLVFLHEGDSYEEGIVQARLTGYPSDRILVIRFISAKDD